MSHKEEYKRLTRNTLFLYVRSAVVMLVSLYTTRVILQNLGADNYGIYSVVSSFVGMFSFISMSLSVAISRFMSIELVNGNEHRIKLIYSSSLVTLVIIAAVMGVVIEMVGVPFLNLKMNIPSSRLYAANWVVQFSIITLIINIISILYDAILVSYEKMSAYAYISIVDVVLKLLIAYLIRIAEEGDKLIFYAFLLMLQAIIVRIIYGLYCRNKFEHCRFDRNIDKNLIKRIASLSGWDVLGAAANMFKTSGLEIIINLFLGPVANAATAIANQIRSALWKFSGGFLTALQPQIVKAYSSGDQKYLFELIDRGTKFSSYLLILFAVPIIVEVRYILDLWLVDVPGLTSGFVILTIILALEEGTIAYAANAAMMATGQIKLNQIIAAVLQIATLPLAYFVLKLDFSPYWVYIIAIIVSNVLCWVRIKILNKLINYSVVKFYKYIYMSIHLIFIASFIVPYIIHLNMPQGIIRLGVVGIISLIWSIMIMFILGCNKHEKNIIMNYLRKV